MAAKRGGSADGNVGDERVVDQEMLHVVVHSSPRYGRFLGIGIFGGLLVAAALTFLSGLSEDAGPISSGPSGVLLVFAVNAAVCVGIGLVITGSLAIILDRFALSRARSATAEHATTLVINMDRPVNDDVPLWVRDSDDLR